VAGNAVVPLGIDRFGQSGDIPDLYRAYGIDTEAILAAAARTLLTAMRQSVWIRRIGQGNTPSARDNPRSPAGGRADQ
jgi:pyruvate dehydrogenase complex dehydrogenase (E1) component